MSCCGSEFEHHQVADVPSWPLWTCFYCSHMILSRLRNSKKFCIRQCFSTLNLAKCKERKDCSQTAVASVASNTSYIWELPWTILRFSNVLEALTTGYGLLLGKGTDYNSPREEAYRAEPRKHQIQSFSVLSL
jgi:hypothetical protein